MELKTKKEKLNKIITIILVGLLLLIIVVPIGDESGESASGALIYEETDGTKYSNQTNVSGASYYEERLKAILEKSYGEDTMEVMVHMRESEDLAGMYQESTYEVDGILIVADVEDDTAVGNISFAVCALFDLPAHKVAVIKK